jgi:predicted permease
VTALKDGVLRIAQESGRRLDLRKTIVVAQVALSLFLLVCAGLFLRSLQNASSIDLGFERKNILMIPFDLKLQGYSVEQSHAFYQQITERVEALPGVRSASFTAVVPLGGVFTRASVRIAGRNYAQNESEKIACNGVGANYFQTMGIPLTRGRSFDQTDLNDDREVVIINEAMAERFWPGEDALGKQIFGFAKGPKSPSEVIGVVKDSKYLTPGEDPRPYIYTPLQSGAFWQSRRTMIVRTTVEPQEIAAPLRREVQALDSRLPVNNIQTMTEHLELIVFPVRLASVLLGIFGLIGLALTATGIYGVISYSVSRRTREIGVHMALGARSQDIYRLVFAQTMRLVLIGISVGLALAFGLTRFLSLLLYGVGATDPLTFATIVVVMVIAAMIACYLPARRAARVDPMVALRFE